MTFKNENVESIKIAYTYTDALNIISKTISNTKKSLDCIFDHRWLFTQIDDTILLNSIIKLKLIGITSRFITKITKDNMAYCKKIMKYSELKHSDKVLGYLGISDSQFFFNYLASENSKENKVVEDIKDIPQNEIHLLSINNQSFVQEQQFLFDNLWNHSTFAREKITEIERKVVENIISNKTIENKEEVLQTLCKIIESSIDQVLILFPNTSSFWDIYNEGILTTIKNAINRDVTVKILIHINDDKEEDKINKDIIRQKLKAEKKEIEINTNFFSKRLQQQYVLFVIDEAMSAMIETKGHGSDKEPSSIIIGAADFSKNISQISSFVSMFDMLWIQTEIEKQSKVKQTYFQMFKGLKLKTEIYKRKWAFEEQKDN
ncbi:MAG TPA: hypothetical protein VN703_08245 [Candidatus Sulfopaludibacter sp.]|nr:hypothetical protein [Candidatus Sulfopaludibacter sp.]